MRRVGAWISRSEATACCPGGHGPVQGCERLARLLHTKIVEPDYDPLRRSDFFPPTKRPMSNECGSSDGCSVIRASGLSDEDVRKLAQAQAARREGREQKGALLAECAALRAIRLPNNDNQVVFVYDDPLGDEPRHAIIRCDDQLHRPDQDELRESIRAAFNEHVSESISLTDTSTD